MTCIQRAPVKWSLWLENLVFGVTERLTRLSEHCLKTNQNVIKGKNTYSSVKQVVLFQHGENREGVL